ncbi:MAG: coiled-coil domain-containing protein [Candidatus Hodarchaeota archaeon]
MKEINLVDITEWFDNKTRKKTEPLKKEAQKKISKCQNIFDEIRIACHTLEEQPPTSSDELITKSAKRFSEKLVKSLDDFEFPEKINFENMDNFKMKLENLLKTIAQYANRWVSKLGRDKSYLQIIRNINYLLRDIQNLYRKLNSFIEKKYRHAINIENIEDLIERLKELIENAKDIKTYETEINNELKENELELNKIQEKIQSLELDENISKLNLINKDLEKINEKIRNLIGPIRKSLKKFSKLINDGGFNPRPDSVSFISSYIDNPITSFLSENNEFSHLKSILLDLEDAINANKLKLKSSSEKKIRIKLKQVKNRDLNSLKSQLDQIIAKKQSLLSNIDYKRKLEDLEELQQKKDTLMRENEEIKLKLNKNIEDYNRALTKLGDYKSKIESSILEITNIEIKLVL